MAGSVKKGAEKLPLPLLIAMEPDFATYKFESVDDQLPLRFRTSKAGNGPNKLPSPS